MANPFFEPFERDFWQLYRACRYWWLVASTVGAVSVGAVQLATGISTATFWELASVVSLWFAFRPMMSRSSEIRYSVFASSAVFDSLAAEVAASVIRARHSGTAQEISDVLEDLRNKYIAEYRSLGADHAQYETANKPRLEAHPDDVLRREGRFGP